MIVLALFVVVTPPAFAQSPAETASVKYSDDEAADLFRRFVSSPSGNLPEIDVKRFTPTQFTLFLGLVEGKFPKVPSTTEPAPTPAAMPPAPSASTDPSIRVLVTAQERDGFLDVNRSLSDSIQDLKNNIRNKRGLVLVADAASADVILRVLARGVISSDGPLMAMPLGRGVIMGNVQNNSKFVRIELAAGEFTKEFGAADTGFGDCAEKIARGVHAWVNANHATLLQRRAH